MTTGKVKVNKLYDNLKDKKIGIIGVGGVGGYLAGMIGKEYPHITLGARNERLESLRKNGFVLHSNYNGEIKIIPEKVVTVDEMEPQDYLFVCVKNYSLEEVCMSMKNAVGDNTVIIPVMNGVDVGDRIRNFVDKGIVIDALIYIVAFANADYSVTHQGNFANLWIGVQNANEVQKQAVEEVSAILSGAGIDHRVADDIKREIWRKYILNCAYNVITAYYDNNVGQLRADERKSKEFEALVNEAYSVALARGVHVTQEHRDEFINRFYHVYDDNATSSLQRDVRMGRQSEVETFSGYIVREARRLQIPAPVSERMYEGLKQKI